MSLILDSIFTCNFLDEILFYRVFIVISQRKIG